MMFVILLFSLLSVTNSLVTKSLFSRPTSQQNAQSSFCLQAKATLDEQTTWKLRFSLEGLPTAQGKKIDQLFTMEAQFLEEEGYEPPQGFVQQKVSEPVDEGEATTGMLDLSLGRWKLSEDPNDRKDGLWIWGLFKEPLYPFLLLQLETKEVKLPGNTGDFIKPLQLYAQIVHTRDEKVGVELKATSVKIRVMEAIKADPFGAASVDVYEEYDVGKISIQPSN
jgi:hypothetical protein